MTRPPYSARASDSDRPTVPIGGSAENHGGDAGVVEMAVGHAAEHAVGEPATGGDRDRRQRRLAGDVADRMDPRHVGRLETVDRDVAMHVGEHARGFEAEAGDVRVAADRPEHGVERAEHAAVLALEPSVASASRCSAFGTAWPAKLTPSSRMIFIRPSDSMWSKCRSTRSWRSTIVVSVPSAANTPPSSTET